MDSVKISLLMILVLLFIIIAIYLIVIVYSCLLLEKENPEILHLSSKESISNDQKNPLEESLLSSTSSMSKEKFDDICNDNLL